MSKTRLITTPIFYANAGPHVGHVYSAVIADFFARWYRLKGDRVVLATGTDEHGSKVSRAAAALGVTPQALCDTNAQAFKRTMDAAKITYNDFIRTSEERHRKVVAESWLKLARVRKSTYTGWFSVADEAFLLPRDTEEKKNKEGKTVRVSKETGAELEPASEDGYAFELRKHADAKVKVSPKVYAAHLDKLMQTTPGEVIISRPAMRVQHGIPVPNDSTQTVYVWFDALHNYLTVARTAAGDDAEKLYDLMSNAIHVIGKDILRFHGVFWPEFLAAQGLCGPKELIAHAHWLAGAPSTSYSCNAKMQAQAEAKMSKSKGNGVCAEAAIQRYGSDAVRYYMMSSGGFEADKRWDEANLIMMYNKYVVGQLANLVARACSASVNPEQIFQRPCFPVDADAADFAWCRQVQQTLPAMLQSAEQHVEARRPEKLVHEVQQCLAQANRMFSEAAPWSPETRDSVRRGAVFAALETARWSATLLQCVAPDCAARVLDRLSVKAEERHLGALHQQQQQQDRRASLLIRSCSPSSSSSSSSSQLVATPIAH